MVFPGPELSRKAAKKRHDAASDNMAAGMKPAAMCYIQNIQIWE